MNTAVLFSPLLCQKLLFTCMCVCVSVCVCVRHPHSAPLKRKASPQRSLRQLHPTTWPQTTRLPITLCHISDFCFHACRLVESLISELCCSFIYLFTYSFAFSGAILGGCGEILPLGARTFGAEPPRRNRRSSALCNFSHTEHVLRPLAGGIPPTPDGSGVRAALTNNKLEQGEGKQRQYLGFPLQRTLFLDRKIGQVRAERLGWGGD